MRLLSPLLAVAGLAGLAALAILPPPATAQTSELQRLRWYEKNDAVTIELQFSTVPAVEIFQLQNPHRLVLDLPDTGLTDRAGQLDYPLPPAAKDWLQGVRIGQHKDFLRLVLDSQIPLTYDLRRSGQIIRLHLPIPAPQVAGAQPVPKRNISVVIDPGHGGKDPGAVSRKGLKEKDIVLEISKKLYQLLHPLEGFDIHLTRSTDVYLPLAVRRQKARDLQADIFVSIHADSVNRSKPSGASVYVLSLSGASSEAARRLAERENTELTPEPQIGGIALTGDNDFDTTIVDLAQTATLERSSRIGDAILHSVAKQSRLHSKQPGKANFVVLRAPYIPSVLVETGFLSNSKDAARLSNERFQRRMARAILHGLYGYLRNNPHPDRITPDRDRVRYRVQQGDTLNSIALRYGLTNARLKRTNSLRNELIRTGQILLLPAPDS